jgi:single-strand DNA-binding protein
MSLAKIVVSGTVISDPEKRFTPNDAAVTNFMMSVEQTTGKDTEPFQVKVTCWRGLADSVIEKVQKGSTVLVDGKLMLGSIQAADGTQKKQYEIDAQTVSLIAGLPQAIIPAPQAGEGGGTRKAAGTPQAAAYGQVQPQQTQEPVGVGASNGGFSPDELLTEDDIPF